MVRVRVGGSGQCQWFGSGAVASVSIQCPGGRSAARLPSCSKTSQLRSVTSAAAGHLSSRGGPSGRRGISRIARCRCALAQSVAPGGCARPPLTVACSTPPSSTRRGSSSPSPTDGARPEPAHACGGAGNQWCCGAGGAAVQRCSGPGKAAHLLLDRAGGFTERLDRRSTHIDSAPAREHAARCGRAVGGSGGGRVGELCQHHVRAPDVGTRRLNLRWAHHAHGHEQPTLVANHARVGHEQLVVGSNASSWQRAARLNGEVVILPRDRANALVVGAHDRWQRREAVGGRRRWLREQRLDAGCTHRHAGLAAGGGERRLGVQLSWW